jgi:hypothetical protein
MGLRDATVSRVYRASLACHTSSYCRRPTTIQACRADEIQADSQDLLSLLSGDCPIVFSIPSPGTVESEKLLRILNSSQLSVQVARLVWHQERKSTVCAELCQAQCGVVTKSERDGNITKEGDLSCYVPPERGAQVFVTRIVAAHP